MGNTFPVEIGIEKGGRGMKKDLIFTNLRIYLILENKKIGKPTF